MVGPLNGILYFKIDISLRFRFQALLHFIKLIWYFNKDLVLRQIYNLLPNNLRMKPLCNTLHNQNNIKIFYNWCTLYMYVVIFLHTFYSVYIHYMPVGLFCLCAIIILHVLLISLCVSIHFVAGNMCMCFIDRTDISWLTKFN
jgi:hypothetical protein